MDDPVSCCPAFPRESAATRLPSPEALTLFEATPAEHFPLAKHLTAEKKTEQFIAGKGLVVKWERLRRQNHWLDALYNACAAGHYVGARLVEEPKPERERVSLAELQRRAREKRRSPRE